MSEPIYMKKILDYLSSLEQNNNREWYHANNGKEEKKEFEQLIQELIFSIGKTDGSILHLNPKDLTFKLVRDTRYSADKSPYNPTFRAHIGPQGKLPVPVGYFLSIRPGNRSFIGGGLFADMFRDATAMIRDAIAENGDEWNRIVTAKPFANAFAVKGTALKKVPAGFSPEHPQAEYLKMKSWYLEYPISDELLLDTPRFLEEAAAKFELMQPFNAFINRALQGFEMPERP